MRAARHSPPGPVRGGGRARVLVAILVACLASASSCGDAAPAPDDGATIAAAAGRPAPDRGAAAPLRLIGVRPPPGSDVMPGAFFELRFDRPVAASATDGEVVSFAYPDPRAEFVGDPFRLTAAWLSDEGDVLHLKPPDLLPGREVVLRIRPGLHARDGGELAPPEGAAPDAARELRYRVLELPPE